MVVIYTLRLPTISRAATLLLSPVITLLAVLGHLLSVLMMATLGYMPEFSSSGDEVKYPASEPGSRAGYLDSDDEFDWDVDGDDDLGGDEEGEDIF